MKPKQPVTESDDLFKTRLDQVINMHHELVILAKRIDWSHIENELTPFYSHTGRAAIPSRLMVGLHLLKATYALSDEAVCERWVESPYFQYFCGETYFQHRFPIERSSMTHWRQGILNEGRHEKSRKNDINYIERKNRIFSANNFLIYTVFRIFHRLCILSSAKNDEKL